MRKIFLLCMVLFCVSVSAQELQAKFTAAEAVKVYYSQGFDSAEAMETWALQVTNAKSTWHLVEKPYVKGIPSFTSFNPDSKYSLAIRYSDDALQNETITSPEILIEQDSQCNFYACFSGVFLFNARWTLAVEETAGGEKTVLFDAFKWAQDVGYEGPGWMPFQFDLDAYAGKKVKFSFNYSGIGGEDVLIDDFRIVQKNLSDDTQVTINEGEKVHFKDMSVGKPTSWNWEFAGGVPAVSTEQHPVVTYPKAGKYSVKLTVNDGTGQHSYEQSDYVQVNCIAPVAQIGLPKDGYLSPWVASFIPLNTPVQFHDLSTGYPTSWQWQLQGSDKEWCDEQHPTVRYEKEGVYSLSLRVANAAGVHTAVLQRAIQAGGEQYIWNISPQENTSLAPVDLAFFGNYGGTNWLGMEAFAEYFSRPLRPATISKVVVYFASIATVTPDAMITVSINASKEGFPGDVLASASLRADELQYSDDTFEETVFEFENPVEVDDEFFVVIGGFPNNSTDKGVDNISMFCSPKRPEGGKCTVYHLLQEWDENDRPTGKVSWMKNVDEALSFAMAPLLNYGTQGSGLQKLEEKEAVNVFLKGDRLHIIQTEPVDLLTIYNVNGEKVYTSRMPDGSVSMAGYPQGLYLVKIESGGKVSTAKVWKR